MLHQSFHKTSLAALGLAAAIIYAPSGSAALTDAGFEAPDASAADIAGCAGNAWDCFNSNFITSNLRNNIPPGTFYNPGAHGGVQMLKQFGSDAGYLQSISANGGDTVDASVHAINWSGDLWSNLGLLQLAYFDASNNELGRLETFAASDTSQAYQLTPKTGADPSEWTLMELSGIAPAGTTRAQILLLHIDIGGGGALFWDDASLTATPAVVPVPAAAWLFGSGLIGLIGIARRRKS